jgi:D-serine deaminase-like pyridoxal phosphate-dependent protein
MNERFTAARQIVAPPAEAGAALADVDTPALVVDLDMFERNIARMAKAVAEAGLRLRPHAKTHKSAEIAKRQIAAGAVGVCCQKVSEAEALVRGGVRDILLSNEIVGRRKLARLAALARVAKIGLCIDHIDGVAEADAAAREGGVQIDCLVEIDVGGERCGVVSDDEAVRIAMAISRSPALRFAGLQAYNGASQHIVDGGERRSVTLGVAQRAATLAKRLNQAGIACDCVTGAGTGTYSTAIETGAFTEIQAGSYIFMDRSYASIEGERGGPFDGFGHALFILTTVMSRPSDRRAVVDAGHKAASVDSGMPHVWNRPGVTYGRPSDEHGVLTGAPLPARGERILLVPGHCDPTVNLHDWFIGVRDLHNGRARVESVWPVDARGAYF